jgi:peptide chain release factor 3
MSLKTEIQRRRTFAIVSHPDAGKTTLTEKLLLFGGAIQVAGAVKSNKVKRGATSDFMEIERQRGISVATSVMGFEYKGVKINILDTPGHQDFAEDTYRTLTAVDSVIVVIDIAKGVEKQTEKLVSVCRMRNTPIIVFINKLDRFGKETFDLLDEIEKKLGLTVCPLAWGIGMGSDFKGVYNIYEQKLRLFAAHGKQLAEDTIEIDDLENADLDQYIKPFGDELREELEIVREVYPTFEREKYLSGEISPVFFGSAINNFGVKELLDAFVEIAPPPQANETDLGSIEPDDKQFSGFVFKIHANMDPKHRNRLAFVRICSGIFERNKNYLHTRLNKKMKFSAPTAFMASKKSLVEQAYPGDIVGLHDAGNFKIGDTLSEGKKMNFQGIPSFSPEIFRYVENADPMKSKQLQKGLEQLMDEGVAQLFTMNFGSRKIIGVLGALQFEVIEYRLKHEYGASCRYESIDFHKACWITCEDDKEIENFKDRKQRYMAKDKSGRDVFLATSGYAIDLAKEQFPKVEFHFKSEF